MKQDMKGTVKELWNMRHLTVEECLSNVSSNPDLKFLLTTAGVWLLIKFMMVVWIGWHVIYLVSRIFKMVAGI